MKKAKIQYYWFGGRDGFEGICIEGTDEFKEKDSWTQSHGPYSSFKEAKLSAISYYQCDLIDARMALSDIKECKNAKTKN